MEIRAILPEWVFSTQASPWQILVFDDRPYVFVYVVRMIKGIQLFLI